ncbi:MAG: penicillin-binding protein 2, partial [Chloroflexi bacterium]|nr:penicillin-binding protein 2 [Chloroflexota bacterium]
FIFVYYIFQLFNLQIVQGETYLEQANENRTSEISVQTQRGSIYDRNGYVLARNVPSYNITITPAYLPEDDGMIQQVYRELSAIIDVPVNNGEINDDTVRTFKPCDTDLGITQIVYIQDTLAPYEPVSIKCDVSEKMAMIVIENAKDWPGTGVETEPVREYPTGWITSEIIGFLGPIPASLEDYYTERGFVPERDKVGYAGIESWFDEELGGTNGTRLIEEDVAGQYIRDLTAPVEPVPGKNIVLTIDTRLQTAAKTALINEITNWNTQLNKTMSSNGVVIAMNPKTGEILALVSYPTFENNRMARIIPAYYYEQLTSDPDLPLFNHAISAELPPGSVFKLATALGIANEHVLEPTDKLEDNGKITIMQQYSPNEPGEPRDYVCWEPAGHGEVDFLHAIALSCDVYFYKASGGYKDEVPVGLNIWRMGEYARALGYGEITGIELPGEEAGLVPDPDWKRISQGENWATGDTYIAAMGQSFVLATPLQVLVSAATIANDGKYMKPTLLREIQDAEGNVIQKFSPTLVRDITKEPVIQVYDENMFTTGETKVVEPWVIDLVQEGMRMVVEEGGTADAQFAGMTVQSAGKTGTAEYCDKKAYDKHMCDNGWPAHAWYVGYAPYDDPEIAVVVFVYNGTEGSTVAAPVARKVMEAYFELKALDEAD